MTAHILTRPEITAFAEAVRAALADLAPEEVDDLTDGLEADLSERADDTAPGGEDFGDPELYADELRAAAGLPERSSSSPRGRRPERSVMDSARALGRRTASAARSTPFGSGVLDVLIALRPVWWVLRGWALYQVVVTVLLNLSFRFLPMPGPSAFLLVALLVVSVQWGRGKWLPRRWLRGVKKTVSWIAAIALLVLVPVSIDSPASSSASADDDPVSYSPPGLSRDGEAIGNIFVYGADGEPLENVQLFDQEGRPLDLIGGSDTRSGWVSQYDDEGVESVVVPSDSVPGRVGWNVYPLGQADARDVDYARVPAGAVDPYDVDPAELPFAQVQPLAESDPDDGAAASESPSPTPSPSTSPSPSVSPSPTP